MRPAVSYADGRHLVSPDDYYRMSAGGRVISGFTCATIARSVQTSESSLVTGIGADLGGIGRLASSNSFGLWLDDACDNLIPVNSQRAPVNAGNLGAFFVSGNNPSPDGASVASRFQCAVGTTKSWAGDVVATTQRAVSYWVRAHADTSQVQLYHRECAYWAVAQPATWARIGKIFTAAGTAPMLGIDGRDFSATGFNISGGGKPDATQDFWLDLLQYSTGRLYHGQWFAGTTCAAQVLTKTTHLDGGRWGVRFKFYLPCSLASLTVVTPYLFYADANNYASINPTTRVITLCIGGTSIACSALGSDPGVGGMLDVYIACGGGLPTVVEASINGGTWTNLFLSTILPNPGFASYQVTKGMGCFLVAHAQYQRGRGPDNGIYYVDLDNRTKDFSDSQTTSNWFGCPVSRGEVSFDTSATDIKVVKDSTINNPETLAYKLDGVWTNVSGAPGLATTSISPSAGSHVFGLRDGGLDYGAPRADRPPSAYWSFLRANAPLIRRNVPKRLSDRCLFIIGDSISRGALATNPATEGYAVLIRDAFPGDVLMHANGGDMVSQYYNSVDFINEIIRRLAGYKLPEILLLLGYNDASLSGGLAVDGVTFGARYATLLDSLITSLPLLQRLWCVGPLTTTTANEAKLVTYRTVIQGLMAARPKCTYIDGTAACSHLSGDGVHPPTIGHTEIFTYVRAPERMNF